MIEINKNVFRDEWFLMAEYIFYCVGLLIIP